MLAGIPLKSNRSPSLSVRPRIVQSSLVVTASEFIELVSLSVHPSQNVPRCQVREGRLQPHSWVSSWRYE